MSERFVATSNNNLGWMFHGLLRAGLGYVRWSQMIPMLLVWAFFLLGVAGALLIGFQEQGVTLLLWVQKQVMRIPWLHEWFATNLQSSGAITDAGGIRLTEKQVVPLAIRGWAILSGLLVVLDWAWRLLRGGERPPPWPLRRKLLLALIATLVGMLVIAAALAYASAGEDVTFTDAVPAAIAAFLLLFATSAYSLSVSHGLGRLQDWLDAR